MPRKYKMNKVKVEPGNEEAKELVTMDKVNQEIAVILQRNKISSYKTKVVKKYYAFDKVLPNGESSIPYENEYLQIEYLSTDHHQKALPADLEG